MHDLLDQTHRTPSPIPTSSSAWSPPSAASSPSPRSARRRGKPPLLLERPALDTHVLAEIRARSCFTAMSLIFLIAYFHDVGVLRTVGDNGIADPSSISTQRRLYLPPALYASTVNAATSARFSAASDDLKSKNDLKKVIRDQGINYTETARNGKTLSGYVDTGYTQQFGGHAFAIGEPRAAPPGQLQAR